MWIGYFQITFSLFLKTNLDAHSLTWKYDSASASASASASVLKIYVETYETQGKKGFFLFAKMRFIVMFFTVGCMLFLMRELPPPPHPPWSLQTLVLQTTSNTRLFIILFKTFCRFRGLVTLRLSPRPSRSMDFGGLSETSLRNTWLENDSPRRNIKA